jgi:hypothetical protein
MRPAGARVIAFAATRGADVAEHDLFGKPVATFLQIRL